MPAAIRACAKLLLMVAMHCHALPCTAMHCHALPCNAMHCHSLLHVLGVALKAELGQLVHPSKDLVCWR